MDIFTQTNVLEDAPKSKKKIFWIIGIVLIIVIILVFYFIGSRERRLTPDQILVQEQKKELDRLSQQVNVKPLTKDETQDQKEVIKEIQREFQPVPLTQDQIKEQGNSLEELRKQLMNQ